MKCLLCNEIFDNKIELLIDTNNKFFTAWFKENIVTSKSLKCHICDKMGFTETNSKIHNFLKHYGEGSRNILAEILLNYMILGDIEIYEIKFSQHKDKY